MQAFSAWGSVLFGMLSILVITPLAALIALRLPLHPPELAFGLAVFCCMPTTLSSGVSLTQVEATLKTKTHVAGSIVSFYDVLKGTAGGLHSSIASRTAIWRSEQSRIQS